MLDSKESVFQALNVAALNCRFCWRVREEEKESIDDEIGEFELQILKEVDVWMEGVVDVGAGEFKLPAVVIVRSSWCFNW